MIKVLLAVIKENTTREINLSNQVIVKTNQISAPGHDESKGENGFRKEKTWKDKKEHTNEMNDKSRHERMSSMLPNHK